MPNVMVALPNTGGALYSTPEFGWRPLVTCREFLCSHYINFGKREMNPDRSFSLAIVVFCNYRLILLSGLGRAALV